MYRCVLKKDDKYYCFEREPSPDLQQALCFESRYDADWTQEVSGSTSSQRTSDSV
jgi:hypothetical protein